MKSLYTNDLGHMSYSDAEHPKTQRWGIPDMHSLYAIMMIADDLAPNLSPGHQQSPCWLDSDYSQT